MAVTELTRRRERLEQFRITARFAVADSYDRATKAQGEKSVGAPTDTSAGKPAEKSPGNQTEKGVGK